ncbi:hypothetical protein N9094_01255 [bacterium]|jgi:hypothetical protein|nr:hypothetical protein [bacterium]
MLSLVRGRSESHKTCASAESPLYATAKHHAWDKVDLLLAHGAKYDVFTALICGRLDLVQAEIRAYPTASHSAFIEAWSHAF